MKLLCSMLVAVLMLSNIAYADVIDDEKVLFQTAIGNDGLKIADIAEDDVITREEMVDVLINLTQIQKDDIYNDKGYMIHKLIHYTPFDDWQVEENKEELVRRLYECAIIKGCSDNKFRPYDACTVEEAITFIVRGLGWGAIDDYEYPQHYIQIAEKIGLCSIDDIDTENADNNLFLTELIFKSLFADTLEDCTTSYGHYYKYQSSPCPLGSYHELGHIYGYATSCENGVMIDDVVYKGEVFNNKNFEEGYVLCVYNKSDVKTEKCIALCLEISEEIYKKYRDKDITRGRACEIADEFFVEEFGIDFMDWVPEIKEMDNVYEVYRESQNLDLESTVVVDKRDGSIISFTAE